MLTVKSNINEWMLCQKKWLYLDLIFTSSDVQESLYEEYRRFRAIDRYMRELSANVAEDASVLKYCLSKERLKRIKSQNDMLEVILKKLQGYLLTVRVRFVRFYMLSDDELLKVMADAQQIEHVQPHLKKMFDNLESIKFSD